MCVGSPCLTHECLYNMYAIHKAITLCPFCSKDQQKGCLSNFLILGVKEKCNSLTRDRGPNWYGWMLQGRYSSESIDRQTGVSIFRYQNFDIDTEVTIVGYSYLQKVSQWPCRQGILDYFQERRFDFQKLLEKFI